MQQTALIEQHDHITELDKALLIGPEATIKYFEPLIAAMSRTRATQDRATLNEDDLRQLGRMTVLRCYKSMDRDPAIRSFDGLVKDAIKKRLITEVGKEFCLTRGQTQLQEFTETIDADSNRKTCTASSALEYYEEYSDRLTTESSFDQLIQAIKRMLPAKHCKVLDILIDCASGVIGTTSVKKKAEMAGMPVAEFASIVYNIQVQVAPFREQLFQR